MKDPNLSKLVTSARPTGHFMTNLGNGLVIEESEFQQIIWVDSKLIVTNFQKSMETAFLVNGISTECKYQKFVDKTINKYTLQTLFNQGCIIGNQQDLALSQFFVLIIKNAPGDVYPQDEQSIFIRAIVKTIAQVTPQSAIWKTQKLLEAQYPEEQVFYDHFEDSALTLINRIYVVCQQNGIALPEITQKFMKVIVKKEF